MRPIRLAVLGASGTTGGELLRLLDSHPAVEVAYLGAGASAGAALGDVHPHLAATAWGDRVLGPVEPGPAAGAAEVAFLALPHGASAQLAPALLEAGLRVIDLAGDFRLPAEAYPAWYGFEHPSPAWLGKAAYGLPELFAEELSDAPLVANPGCFPTAVVLGLAPLLRAGAIEPGPIHVDGKTGLSGAGTRADRSTMHLSTEESVRPYRFPVHQHTPEMEHALALAGIGGARIAFVPHLVPAVRGVLVTCYAPLVGGATSGELTEILAAAYEHAPFVRVLAPGAMADTKRTRGSNVIELQAVTDPRTGSAVVIGALDNLVKGAAGQAVQNLNLMHGLDQALGLPRTAVYP
ncbi:MAG: N-acetyl-gamma-glutamyl-phosphate reductase [Candidatus Velamenicoccus archaeovorus]